MKKKLLLFSIVLCLSGLVFEQASATIIYTDVAPDVKATTLSQNNPAFQFDIDGGGVDFGIGADFNSGDFYDGKILNITDNVTFAAYQTGADAAKNVGFGTTIDASTLWTNRPAGYSHYTIANSNGMWNYNVDGYIGVKLTVGSNVYYGWIRVYEESGSSGGFIVKDFAYENTPGQAITAGAMPPVPINYTFTSAGNWTDPTKWTPSYPGTNVLAGNIITIAATCTMDASVTSASPITVNVGASFTVNSTLTIGSTFTNNGNFTTNNGKTVSIQSTGTFTHDGTNASISGPINNSGSFVVNAGKTISFSANGSLTHDGTNASIAGSMNLTGNCTVNTGKTLTIEAGGTLTYDGNNTSSLTIWGTFINNGTYSVTGVFANTFVNPGGTFTHNGISADIQGQFTNAGTLNVNAGKTFNVRSAGNLTHNGTSVSIDGTLSDGPFGGNITINSGKTLTINSGGTLALNGSGVMTVSGTVINNGDLTIPSSSTTNSMTINAGGTLTHSGTSASISRTILCTGNINVSSGSTFTVESGGSISTSPGAIITINGMLVNNGQFQPSSGSLTINNGGKLQHDGTVCNMGSGSIQSGGNLIVNGTNASININTFTNNGTIAVNTGKTLAVTFGNFVQNSTSATINGSLTNTNGTVTINAGQSLTIANGGSFTHSGNSLTISGILAVNSGAAFTQNANSQMNVAGTIANDGSVTVNSGKTLNISSGGTFTNNGTVTNNGSFSNGGTLNGTGSFTGSSITNSSGGTIAPGASPGCLSFSSLNSSNGSTLSIEINGTSSACTDYDKITASGSASLNGSLNLSIGYSPTIGDVITVIEAGSISGTFSSVTPALAGWTVLYNNPSIGRVSVRYDGPPPPAPSNDACSGAISVSVNATGACNYVSGTTVSATSTTSFPCSFGESSIDVWYSFTAPSGGAVTFHSGSGGPFAAIYSGNCNGLSPVANGCNRGNGTVTDLAPGNTYYLGIFMQNAGVFDFCLEVPSAPPANNDCTNASPLDMGNQVPINSIYATTVKTPSCAPSVLNVPDLWYTFTAASNTIAYTSGGGTLVLSIYSGSCSNLVEKACAIPFGPLPTNLVPGTTYFAQISSLGAVNNGSATITAPNTFTFTGAVSNAWTTATNWTGGAVPGSNSSATIGAGETCTLDASTTTGSVTVQPGSTFNISDGVVLTANGGVTNNGTIAPGNSLGCATITGNFTNTATGTLAIEVNGKATACTDYDKLTFTGTADITGSTLVVTVGGSYSPANGDKITFLEAGTISGNFASTSLPSYWTVKYDVSGTVYLEFASALPVELVSFRASKADTKVQLDWQTASELNNQGFEVQRSADAKHWETLHFVEGHGTSLELHQYLFMDERPLSGVNYYRLRQVDFDGKMEYSPTVSIEMGGKGGMHIFPNPASSEATLQLDINFEGDGTITWYDLTGKQLKSQTLNITGSPQQTKLDLSNLPCKGIYLLELNAGGKTWHQRILLN